MYNGIEGSNVNCHISLQIIPCDMIPLHLPRTGCISAAKWQPSGLKFRSILRKSTLGPLSSSSFSPFFLSSWGFSIVMLRQRSFGLDFVTPDSLNGNSLVVKTFGVIRPFAFVGFGFLKSSYRTNEKYQLSPIFSSQTRTNRSTVHCPDQRSRSPSWTKLGRESALQLPKNVIVYL